MGSRAEVPTLYCLWLCERGCTAHGPLCWPPSTRKGTLRPTACWGTRDLLTAECAPLHRQIAVCPSGRPPADGCLICPGARCCQQLFSRVGAGREARNGLRNGLRWLFTAAACPPSAPGSAPCHARDLGSSTPPAPPWEHDESNPRSPFQSTFCTPEVHLLKRWF